MDARLLQLTIAVACLWRCQCLKPQQEIHQRRGPPPNIVIILADDLGTNDVGWVNRHNVNDIKTPNLDSLAAEGAKLTNFYVQPICGPSRAALLTGRYPIHLGLQHANIVTEQENGVPTNESTVATVLKSMGYTTYGVGKWHLGSWSRELIPTRRGFDHWYGFLVGAEDHFDHTASCGGKRGLDLWINEQPDTAQRGVYSTRLFTDRAVQFIRRHAEEKRQVPFFMYLAYSAVHTPLQAPEDALARFSHMQGNRKRMIYAAMLSLMDDGVGNVTAALRETQLMENTVVIFLSDNGGQVQEGGNNWPLRGWKGSLWEGGLRTQAFVHSPLLPSSMLGQSWGGLLHITDVMPTILGLAGDASDHGLDGYDFWPALTGNSSASPRSEILLNIDPVGACTEEALAAGILCDSAWGVRNAALRWNEYKLIQRYPGDWPSHQDGWIPPPGFSPPAQLLAASEAKGCGPCEFHKAKLAEEKIFDDSQICLFNVQEDPEERCNIAASHPQVVEHMLMRLQVHNQSAVPVRYPTSKPGRCNPTQFGNVLQWWTETQADGADSWANEKRAAPALQGRYEL